MLDVGDICHLADLTIKSSIMALPVDIDQLYIDVFYYSYPWLVSFLHDDKPPCVHHDINLLVFVNL